MKLLSINKSTLLAAAFGLALAIGTTSCDKRFGEINTDPNRSTETSTAFLLNNAQREMMDRTWDEWWNSRRGNQLAQYWSSNQYSNESRYQFRTNITNTYWNGFYAVCLQDLQEIINLNTSEETRDDYVGYGKNENQIAVAKIMQTWMFQNMTDCWGPIPYADALQAAEEPFPAYNSQEEVYTGMLAALDEALGLIDESDNTMQGDLIYSGDMSKWTKFANSLKMRVALRMADVNGATAQTAFEAAAANCFTSNADNAIFQYLPTDPNINPQAEDYKTRNDFAASNTMVNELDRLGDPRIGIFYEPAENTGTFVGEVYGLTEADAATTVNADISQRGTAVLQNSAPGVYLDYAQVEFMLAEAIERGWSVSGTVKEHYNSGIQASMDFWNDGTITQTDIDNYIAQGTVDYDSLTTAGETWKQVIGRQKWVALYMQGVQGWTEWRRLDFGILQAPAGGALQGNGIPARMIYPVDEQTLNGENYAAGVSTLGGSDDLGTKLWWDVN